MGQKGTVSTAYATPHHSLIPQEDGFNIEKKSL